MTRPATVVCLMALLLPVSGKGTDQGSESRAQRENFEASIAWDDAFNSEDVDAVMALYADGAVSMPPGFPALVGTPLIRADYEFLFENYDFHHTTTVVQLEIQGAMAVERGEYTMLVVPADGSDPFVETGKHMILRRKINDSWQVIIETWNTH
jgi:ketosteroid isomerase-like protein